MDVDHDALAESLSALAYPARLDLLEQLHVPLALSDIRVRARRGEPGLDADRLASKQATLAHLTKLKEAGLVRLGEARVQGRDVPTYAVDAARLYGVIEALRAVGARHAGWGRSADETGTLGDAPSGSTASGPRLVLVHGLYEGNAYPLARRGAWTIGRSKEADVALDYDPYVSAEHARVERTAFGYRIHDARESKNGTSVNWRRIPQGGWVDLSQGDIIGVGKSLLAFYER